MMKHESVIDDVEYESHETQANDEFDLVRAVTGKGTVVAQITKLTARQHEIGFVSIAFDAVQSTKSSLMPPTKDARRGVSVVIDASSEDTASKLRRTRRRSKLRSLRTHFQIVKIVRQDRGRSFGLFQRQQLHVLLTIPTSSHRERGYDDSTSRSVAIVAIVHRERQTFAQF